MTDKPELIVMVGLPSSGKNTWVAHHVGQNPDKDYVVLSTDDALCDIGKEQGITDAQGRVRYQDTITAKPDLANYTEAKNRVNALLKQALSEGKNIILNRTHTTLAERKPVIDMAQSVASGYDIKAVVLDTPLDIIKERLPADPKQTPVGVVESKHKSFQMPTPEEGFSSVTVVTPGVHSARAGTQHPEYAKFVPPDTLVEQVRKR